MREATPLATPLPVTSVKPLQFALNCVAELKKVRSVPCAVEPSLMVPAAGAVRSTVIPSEVVVSDLAVMSVPRALR